MSLSRTIAASVVEHDIKAEKLMDVLREYNLVSLLPTIKEEVEKLKASEVEGNTIHIESPFPLNDSALARIKRIVGNDLADTHVTINKDLLSGFKARFKGKLFDASGQRIINKLTQH